jgi:hypothetical protein
MKMRKLSLSVAGLLVCYSNAVADQIIIDFTGNVTSVGSAISSDTVFVGDTVNGQIVYDPNSTLLGYTYAGEGFDIDIESATAGPGGGGGIVVFEANSYIAAFSTQNDQQNGSATLRADGFIFSGSPGSSDGLNDRYATGWQFGLRRENILGHLWEDTDPPDFSDWAGVTLADINAPDWHWMQLEWDNTSESIFDAQIRWDITSFEATSEAPGGRDPEIPEPATMALLGLGLAGFAARSRKRCSA